MHPGTTIVAVQISCVVEAMLDAVSQLACVGLYAELNLSTSFVSFTIETQSYCRWSISCVFAEEQWVDESLSEWPENDFRFGQEGSKFSTNELLSLP